MDLLSYAFNMAAHGAAFVGVAAAAALGVKSLFYQNKQNQQTLITRFGKHVRTAVSPGLHMKTPFLDKVAKRINTALFTSEETLNVKTHDDIFIKLPVKIQYEIADPAKFYFGNENSVAQMKQAVIPSVSQEASKKSLHDLFGDRDEIGVAAIEKAREKVQEYGLKIRWIIVEQPIAPPEVQNAFNEVRASERMKEAARNKADAHAIEVVANAEAKKKAEILAGEGSAGFREKIFDQYAEQMSKLGEKGVPREEAVDVMLRIMEQDTRREIGNKGNLVIITDGNSSGIGERIAELQTLNRTRQSATPEQDNGLRRPAATPAPAPSV